MDQSSDPSIHQVRLFLVLAEELHFGRAARRVYISQPAFSRQIRRLEEHLGIALVERSTRRVELTAAGRDLLPAMRALTEAADALRCSVAEEVRTVAGRLVLGSYITALPVVTELVALLQRRHPRLEVDVREVDFVAQTSALLDGSADAVLCYAPVPAGIQTLRLASEPQVACLPEGHPLADRASVSLAELAGTPVVGLAPTVHREWRDFWAADPRPDGTSVSYSTHTATTFESSVSAVSRGHGMRFVSAACRELFPRPGIRYVDVSDAPPCAAVLAWTTARRDTPVVVALRRAAADIAAALRGVPDPRWWHTGFAAGT
ncbi:LysR substrate-binding domain-containing protein [Streptomyces sp. NPDC059169]|uniref:LysR substrate-binding domain-containing protein n=1 Tax=unclassified Streptomyces TaxID=2593676 RepID=UPI00368B5D1F